jgi:hypothetical protein
MLGGAAAKEMDDKRNNSQHYEDVNEPTRNVERQPGNDPNGKQTERQY